MLRNTVVDRFNINIIDYTSYFCTDRSIDIVDELYDHGISPIDADKFQNDVHVATSHHIFSGVCDFILSFKASHERPVMYIDRSKLDQIELSQYYTKQPLSEFVISLFKFMKSAIGIKYHVSCVDFDRFKNLVNSRDGETIELLSEIHNDQTYNLYKMKKHVEKHGLTGLSRDFFDNQRLKQVLI